MQVIFKVSSVDASKESLAKLIVRASDINATIDIDVEESIIVAEFSNFAEVDNVIDFANDFFSISKVTIINDTSAENTKATNAENTEATDLENTEATNVMRVPEKCSDSTVNEDNKHISDAVVESNQPSVSNSQLIREYIMEKELFTVKELKENFSDMKISTISSFLYREKQKGIISSTGNRGEYKVNK